MGAKKVITEEEKEQIVYLYDICKKGQMYCAKQVWGTTNVDLVKKVLKEKGVHIRTATEATFIHNLNQSQYNKNHNYFKTESSNMAWILGFLAADGSISKRDNNIHIALSIKDIDVLEKIKTEIEIENPIKTYTTANGFDCCRLDWVSPIHKQDLALYDIVPNKTFLLKPPYKLNKQYWIDYIRGYFDGDGSVNLVKAGRGKALRWQIGGATKEVLQWIVDFFKDEYNIKPVSILEDNHIRKSKFYYFQYSSIATRQIYSILYTPNSLYLQRKKEHFDDIIKGINPLNQVI